jgi:hypothetical protein
MSNSASSWDTAGAVLLLLWAVGMWASVGFLAYARRRWSAQPWMYSAGIGVVVLGVLGQIGHIQEHVAQAGYWALHPNDKPWMTPWGTGLANGMGQVDTSKPSLGMEILHLTGNFIFLAGLVGIMIVTRPTPGARSRKWGRMGTWMQGIHGLEHLSLTLSVAFGAKQAIGLSTWFGLLDPGPGLWTYRIWWHLIANLMGSIIFGVSVYHLWRERSALRAAHSRPETPPSSARTPGRLPAPSAGASVRS